MHITLLLAEHSSQASATLALEVLDAANRPAAPSAAPFAVVVASLDGLPVKNALGRTMAVDVALDALDHTDLVLVPGFLFSLREALPAFGRYRDWLCRQHRQGAVIASMCTATFMLAEAGLLDGVQATTHWAFADLMRRRYPAVRLDERRILCEDGRLISSAGASAAMDLLLHLIRRFASRELAQQCSRYLLVDGVRSEQSVYIQWSMPRDHADEAVARVRDWLESNFTAPSASTNWLSASVSVRATSSGDSRMPPATPPRLPPGPAPERAKHLLETTRLGFDAITTRVGYEDANSFRRLFCQRVGISPAAFRKRFLRLPAAQPEPSR